MILLFIILLSLCLITLEEGHLTPEERREKVATIKYTTRWWHSQLEGYPLQKVCTRLIAAERQGLVKKDDSGYRDYRVYIPCKNLGKNKKEREEKIFDFLLKNA